ncbi:MAG: hypothetical protein WCI52_02175 [bacterium]
MKAITPRIKVADRQNRPISIKKNLIIIPMRRIKLFIKKVERKPGMSKPLG